MLVKRNENTAELVGLSFGDGGLTYRKDSNRVKFQLRGDLSEEKENYDSYIIPLFNQEVMQPLFRRDVGIVYNKRMNFYGLSTEGVRIEKPLNFLGIPSGVKDELTIPRWIKKNKTYCTNFLRGFFDSDGSVFCQKNYSIKNNTLHTQIRIYLVSTSRFLINDIFAILKKRGFKCLKEEKNPKESYPDGYTRKKSYRLKICGGIQVNKWFNEIGSRSKKHLTKYNIWKKFGFCPPRTKLKDRKKILKNKVCPYTYYKRKCQSGQMDDVKAVVA